MLRTINDELEAGEGDGPSCMLDAGDVDGTEGLSQVTKTQGPEVRRPGHNGWLGSYSQSLEARGRSRSQAGWVRPHDTALQPSIKLNSHYKHGLLESLFRKKKYIKNQRQQQSATMENRFFADRNTMG